MKLSPWNVNLAKSEKRHNGLTDVTAKEVLIRFWENERWEVSLPSEAWNINKKIIISSLESKFYISASLGLNSVDDGTKGYLNTIYNVPV